MRGRRIRKVLLFIPPAFTLKDALDINPLPPLGLGYIGAVLENNGVEVKIVDCLMEGWDNRVDVGDNNIRIGLSFDKIREIIEGYAPDIVGVNNLFTKQRENAHNIYKLAKSVNEDIITIAGGAHPTVMPELVLSDKNVDYVVIGEGEDTIIDLVNYIEGKRDISMLDGVGYKEDGRIRIIPKTKFITDLDKLPFPARHLLNMEKYFGLKASHGSRRKDRFSPIITSRGCPAMCTFCSAHKVWGRRYRARSPENVIAEMKEIKEKYGIQEIMFEDDNVTMNAKRAEKIFDLMIQEKLDFVWDTPNGVAAFALNEKLIRKMKESGCYKMNLALESGSQYVLDNVIKKPLKLDKMLPLVNYAREIDLEVGAFFVVGMPGETKEQIRDSFRLAKKWKFYAPFISIATPYPGTEIYEICKEKGYLFKDYNLNNLVIFKHSFETPQWTAQELDDLIERERLILRFHFYIRHPVLLLKRFLSKLIYHPEELFLKLFKIFKYLIT